MNHHSTNLGLNPRFARNSPKSSSPIREALNVEDWAGFAGFCDPVSLRAFKREILEEFGEYRGPRIRGEIEESLRKKKSGPPPPCIELICLEDEWFNPVHRVRRSSIRGTVEELREMDRKAFARGFDQVA